MTNGAERKEKLHGRLRIALAVLAVLVLALVVPPLISVSHYKGQITHLIAQSLGRPVRLSSVEVRLLPWPGFVLSGPERCRRSRLRRRTGAVCNQVTASLRLLALWRGKLEIDKISVDDAHLNLVRAGPGRWNLDPIFRTAAAQTGVPIGGSSTHKCVGRRGPTQRSRLPSLEATNSRINFKNGAEKLPFSLLNADISLWQASPGEWRIRLRGQPARTDVSLYQEETGVVRMEASVRSAPALRQMPLHLDLDWREAQLGQLARLITGSDPGWRGDLTGDLHIDGTADAAQIAMRLRATGVHRAEFAPAAPMDFDANCSFVYHHTQPQRWRISPAIRPWATAACASAAKNSASTRRRSSPWKWIAFPWRPDWTRCAPCAAASIPISRPAARSAEKLSTPPSQAAPPNRPNPRRSPQTGPQRSPKNRSTRSTPMRSRPARLPAASRSRT